MTTYFDNLTREVRKASEQSETPTDFLSWLSEIEQREIAKMSLVTGDREFPDEIRKEIWSAITRHRVCSYGGLPPLEKAKKMAGALRNSPMLEAVHNIFHRLPGMEAKTRFGLLDDKPDEIIKRRDAHDGTTIWGAFS